MCIYMYKSLTFCVETQAFRRELRLVPPHSHSSIHAALRLSTMHARPLVLIVMLMFAASAHADNAIQEQRCAERALDVCGESSGDDYEIVKAHCLAAFWIALSHSNQCPHPAVNCRCYNGCVQDRSGSVRDVGGWCTDTCRKSLQDSTCY
ncbi:hypothetical protein V8E36_006891 [Tilletia maclaganii]